MVASAAQNAAGQLPELARSPLRPYARAELDQSWQELTQGDMQEPQLEYSAYLTLVGKLRRNLLVGVSFAALFDDELQQASTALVEYFAAHGRAGAVRGIG